jgi:hypothetical protein
VNVGQRVWRRSDKDSWRWNKMPQSRSDLYPHPSYYYILSSVACLVFIHYVMHACSSSNKPKTWSFMPSNCIWCVHELQTKNNCYSTPGVTSLVVNDDEKQPPSPWKYRTLSLKKRISIPIQPTTTNMVQKSDKCRKKNHPKDIKLV